LAIAWRAFDHLAAVLYWLILIGMGTVMVRGLVGGTGGYGGSFSLGNLRIVYRVNSGGLLPERLAYAMITPDLAQRTTESDDGGGTLVSDRGGATIVFARDPSATIKVRRGETAWIDAQYRVTSLDRVLRPRDIRAIEKLSDREKPTISSPEEFLAIVAELRGKQTAKH
jgi:hypothetical protein